MPSRKNLKHRIKARRQTALRNLNRRLDNAKYWFTPKGEKAVKKLEKAQQEADVLESRIGLYS